jgi:hypothetical protein
VLYSTHFLAGAAGAWWENVGAMQPEGQVMTWDAFKAKFRKAHIPSGLIKIMRDKFLNLKQGGMSVTEYLDKFTTWGRYRPALASLVFFEKLGQTGYLLCRSALAGSGNFTSSSSLVAEIGHKNPQIQKK